MNSLRTSVLKKLSPTTVGAVYVWLALIVLFSVMEPISFANSGTAKLVLNQYAVTALVALALLLPLCAGLFDLSVGAVAGLSGMTCAWFLANVSANPWAAIAFGLAMALMVGLVNSFVVLVLGVDSFIGTLAISSIVTAAVLAISGQNAITENVNGDFQQLFLKNIGGVTVPPILMLLAMVALGYVMERTVFGRQAYATGFDREVARMGGVPVDRIRMVTFLVSALLAGLAGICATALIGAGDFSVGPNYLLPAFAAAFLGATQFRGGRFNPWGTVVATLLLGTAGVGLLVAGAPVWAPAVFDGALLIVAVALTSSRGSAPLAALLARLRRSDSGGTAAGQASPATQRSPSAEQDEPVMSAPTR